ncbi:MAG: methyltransferase domain-containing protein [bacterium]
MTGFFLQYLFNPKQTGAVAPSSDELSSLLAQTPDLKNARVVVEFGPGTGVVTRHILHRVPRDGVFFALEMNPRFVEETKKRCPQALIYQDSAAHVKKYLHQHHHETCDCIISGMPWASFDDQLQKELLHATVEALKEGGEFATFAYWGFHLLAAGRNFKKMLKKNFSSVKTTRVIWKNLPPAFVYHCKK